jgi:hypothetical protein
MSRSGGALSAVTGGIAGIAPHALHHVAPILGAAVLTGVTGMVVFGVAGLVLMIPMLLRLRNRFETWAAPAVALVLFLAMFSVSTLAIGPFVRGAISGDAPAAGAPVHETHHPGQ